MISDQEQIRRAKEVIDSLSDLSMVDSIGILHLISKAFKEAYKDVTAPANKALHQTGKNLDTDLGKPSLMEYYEYPEGKPRR